MGTVNTAFRRTQSPRAAFILLEVMVSLVIVGVSMTALLRGFVMSLDTVKKVRMNEVAIFLAEAFVDDLVLEPPPEGRFDGRFDSDPRFGEAFEGWQWELTVEAEEPRYRERPRGLPFRRIEHEYHARIVIAHRDDFGRTVYLTLDTILMDPDVFSLQSMQANQLFW